MNALMLRTTVASFFLKKIDVNVPPTCRSPRKICVSEKICLIKEQKDSFCCGKTQCELFFLALDDPVLKNISSKRNAHVQLNNS